MSTRRMFLYKSPVLAKKLAGKSVYVEWNLKPLSFGAL